MANLLPHERGFKAVLKFWIPRHGFWIPGTGFRILCQWELNSGFQIPGFPITRHEFPGFRIQQNKFPRFWIPQAKFSRIPESLTWGDIYVCSIPTV